MTSYVQCSAAGAFFHGVIRDSKMKGTLSSLAEINPGQLKSLKKALWVSNTRKPRSPYLDGLPVGLCLAAAFSRIHQKITEPPRPAAIR